MKIRPGTMDQSIVDEMNRDIYFARGRINNGDIGLDCGANIGAFAKFILSFAPEAKVICIEPIASNVELCRENLKDEPSCTVINAALMGSNGVCCIYDFGPRSSACHSIFDLGIKGAQAIHVPAIIFQKVMEWNHLSKIDFLKLDVQGAEFEIIPNTPVFILDKINYISMEIHSGISNDVGWLGFIPDYQRKIPEVVNHLSKTHILLQRCGNVQLWKNKRYVGRVEGIHSKVKKIYWNLPIWVQHFCRQVIPVIPVPAKKIIRHLLGFRRR